MQSRASSTAESSTSSASSVASESTATSSTPSGTPTPSHPFAHAKGLLVVIPQDKVDVEEESAFYDEFDQQAFRALAPRCRSPTYTVDSRSLVSGDIWLGDASGESTGFTKDVKIGGWTSVGDKLGGAYVVYDCAVLTKEGTTFHILKRYSDFEQLSLSLRRTLPRALLHNIPSLPPKSPLARYRPTFLESRRRRLQHWLATVLLHPDVGGCQAVRHWVMA
ncbi:Phox-like protein [Gautieria morchelliformis]|nr:Phox-like protein [Gautieria morchelliformis]